MSAAAGQGQLVRLTTEDYKRLREALVMADAWRGGKMPEDWPEFDRASARRWAALEKIATAVYPRKRAATTRAIDPRLSGPA